MSEELSLFTLNEKIINKTSLIKIGTTTCNSEWTLQGTGNTSINADNTNKLITINSTDTNNYLSEVTLTNGTTDNGGIITFKRQGLTNLTLNLPLASRTISGAVSTEQQNFAGKKIFNDNIEIGQAGRNVSYGPRLILNSRYNQVHSAFCALMSFTNNPDSDNVYWQTINTTAVLSTRLFTYGTHAGAVYGTAVNSTNDAIRHTFLYIPGVSSFNSDTDTYVVYNQILFLSDENNVLRYCITKDTTDMTNCIVHNNTEMIPLRGIEFVTSVPDISSMQQNIVYAVYE